MRASDNLYIVCRWSNKIVRPVINNNEFNIVGCAKRRDTLIKSKRIVVYWYDDR